MESIHNNQKGDHLCVVRPLYFHHFIVTANYVTQGFKNDRNKQFGIIEFIPQKTETIKWKVVASDKNLDDYGGLLYKIKYSSGEEFDSGK